MRYLVLILCSVSIFACDWPESTTPAVTPPTVTVDTPKESFLPFIHTVFFWETEGLSETGSAALRQGIESLRRVPSAGKVMIGRAAGSEQRDVVDHSYDHALIIHFADQAAQEAYQSDPIHLKFVEDHQNKWRKVVVYDSLVE